MELKRKDILERSSQVFMKYGIKSVTMDDIARELGISKKTIYQVFNDKNELVISIIKMKVELDKNQCLNCQMESENAIDALFMVNSFIADKFANMNPTVIYDLQKYHPDAWQIMIKHKWEFIITMISENIERGRTEGLYRDDFNKDIISRFYVGSTDLIFSGDLFPWPEFKIDQLFTSYILFYIRGIANEKGLNYLNSKTNSIHHE